MNKWIYALGFGFLAINAIAIAMEQYVVLLLPFVLAIIGIAFFQLDKLMMFVVFTTPLSITLTDPRFNVGLSLPTEPLLAGILLLLVLRFLINGKIDVQVIRQPLSMAILLYLTWIFTTTLTSEMPLVSLKFFIAKLWFIVPYFFLMIQIFRKKENIEWSFWLFYVPLCMAGLYTMVNHSQYGFSKQTSTWVMYPFFKEHTSYGAVLAMYYPIAVYFVARKQSPLLRAVSIGLFMILTASIILSYTRAAWVSIVAAGMVWVVFKLKIKFKYIAGAALGVLVGIALSWGTISDKLNKNKEVSSDDFGQHVASISNVSTDASNLERINRWMSALRMFEARPHTGWGPGTYMFLYAPFQKPSEMTIISTNAGNMGNAHSEYIGPLAETGWPGLLTIVIMVTTMMISGFKSSREARTSELRSLALSATLGLVTYFVHGFLNNYLDMDKASAPVWGFCAIIVAIQLYHKDLDTSVSKSDTIH